jgi:hypothetical protein
MMRKGSSLHLPIIETLTARDCPQHLPLTPLARLSTSLLSPAKSWRGK